MTTRYPVPFTLRYLAPFLAGVFTIIVTCLLQQRIGVSDCDSEGYLLGARSLAHGRGYVDLLGIPLNHWPPGYSLLLSLWKDPKLGALVINTVCMGLAVSLTAVLAHRNGWSLAQGLSLSIALGFGLYLTLAQFAKPDILCYTVFLAAVISYGQGSFRGRVGACILFCLLIPVKLIAVTFAPGILLAELFHLRPRPFLKSRWREVIIGGGMWCVSLGGLLWYNARTLKSATPHSYVAASLHSVLAEVVRFLGDFFRSGLACWYGSIRPLSFLIPFAIVVLLGLACLSSLRRGDRWSFTFKAGVAILVFSWGLEFYRIYYAGPRLMGYGMILMLLGINPLPKSTALWGAYAFATLALAVANHTTVCNFGINHPTYEASAQEANANLPGDATVYTNANRLLDIHTGRPSIFRTNLDDLPPGSWYWQVNLPNFDAIAQPIGPIPAKDHSWNEQVKLSTGSLLHKSR